MAKKATCTAPTATTTTSRSRRLRRERITPRPSRGLRRLSFRLEEASRRLHRKRAVKVLGVLLFLVACGRHPASAPTRALDGGIPVATPLDAPRAAAIDASADANADAGWSGSVMDYAINSDGTPALTHPASAPTPPLDDQHRDRPPIEHVEHHLGDEAWGPQEPGPMEQGSLGHGAKYRRDAGATP